MKWVRCPWCRTISDIDLYSRCGGCSADLADAAELKLKAPRSGALEREATRDSVAGDYVILVLGGLCIISLITILAGGRGGTLLLAIPTFPALVIVLWLVLTRPLRHRKSGVPKPLHGPRYSGAVRDAEPGCLVRGIAYVAALVASGIGAFILLKFACPPLGEIF